jgi:hypothetical protein
MYSPAPYKHSIWSGDIDANESTTHVHSMVHTPLLVEPLPHCYNIDSVRPNYLFQTIQLTIRLT